MADQAMEHEYDIIEVLVQRLSVASPTFPLLTTNEQAQALQVLDQMRGATPNSPQIVAGP